MTVQAKMRVTSRKEQNWTGGVGVDAVEVILQPVYSSDPASTNYSWSKATPSGEVKLQITNPGAYEQFRMGQTFIVEFNPVDGL